MSTLTPLDELLTHVDRALKAVFVTPTPARPMPQPGPHHDPNMALSDSEQRTAAALMRVNHAGEVAAQALYHGQAAFARRPQVRTLLLQSAREEADHLAWANSAQGRVCSARSGTPARSLSVRPQQRPATA